MLSDGRWNGPILDQHMHLDRNNRYLGAVEEFVRVGGSGINLVHKPDFANLPVSIEQYQTAYDNTISMAEEVRKKFNIDVSVILGPHPVAWEHQIHSLGMEAATDLHLDSIDLALEYITKGNSICLGEVGRPHYSVSDEIWTAANNLLEEILKRAAEQNASVQLHVEDAGAKTYEELADICDAAGMPRERAIRHYAPANVSDEFTCGLAATVSVGKGSIEGLLATTDEAKSPWGMETDYLDDPKRPGAVLGPKTIPKRTNEFARALIERGNSESEVARILSNIHEDWPKKLYS